MIYEDKNSINSSTELEELYFDEERKDMPKSPLSGKLKGVISHDYFYDKYIKSDLASAKFDESVNVLRSSPESLSFFLSKNNATLYSFENSLIGLINSFTTKDTDSSTLNLMTSALRVHSKIDYISQNGDTLCIKLKDGAVINSRIMSKTMGWDIDELESNKRLSKAHQMSVELARILPNSRVVTGKVAGLTSKSSYLHSWVETTMEDGKVVVFDYTMNSIINKNGYYALRHANQISAINGSDLADDLEKVSPFIKSGELSGKEYLIYRETIMEALNESEQ